jgi:hypothetical protein
VKASASCRPFLRLPAQASIAECARELSTPAAVAVARAFGFHFDPPVP